MKRYFILSITIFLALNIYAQQHCTTPACEPPAWFFSTSTKSANTSSTYNLNVFIHIVRSNNGNGLSSSIRNTIVSLLNSSYSDANIQFSLLGYDYIDNDDYFDTLEDSELDLLFSENAHCNAIDIYILGENTTFGAAGRADGLFSSAFIVHGDFYDTSTLPHEMGHCFGLYHTFHGTDPDAGTDDPDRCAELVDGTNSDTCGDYIEDTPADPNDFSGTSCTYNGTGTDVNGDSYNPDPSNYMCYVHKSCRINLTDGQIVRIRDAIVNTNLLQNTIAADSSGPSAFCTSATFTLNNLPSTVTSIDWDHGPFLSISSGEDEEECIVNSTGNGSSWVRPTLVVTGCGTIPLPRQDVYVGKPNPDDITIVDLGPNYPNSMVLCDDMPNDGRVKWDHQGGILEYAWSVYDDSGNTWQVNQHPNDPFPTIPMQDV